MGLVRMLRRVSWGVPCTNKGVLHQHTAGVLPLPLNLVHIERSQVQHPGRYSYSLQQRAAAL
jgi:hypothetical protein